MIDEKAVPFAERPAFVEACGDMTYRDLVARKNQYARWARASGLQPGEVVCLMMMNCADYVALWLGLTQVGVIAALVNTSLTGETLLHALRLCGSAHIITDDTCASAVERVSTELPRHVRLWQTGSAKGAVGCNIINAHAMADGPLTDVERVRVTGSQTALLLFTSGTTGLPKAAPLSHTRMLEWCLCFAGLINAGPRDRLYDCLPMYHATGGILGCGAMLLNGGAVIVRRRFSAAAFWPDIEAACCTVFLYIGELCRYLLQASPRGGSAPPHHLRLCCGNGLQADIWDRFLERFAIPRVLEFYASTEGNVALYNCEARRGALGRLPPFLAHRSPIALAACDPETGELLRAPDGFCRQSPPGVPGEALGRIGTREATSSFEGYTDRDATSRKVARDVLALGDAWFRTGDLMRKDGDGYYYFIDRLGDTFRWKGENVSTTQVEQAILACPGVSGAVVYPVRVPGHDGRAGMAAITTEPSFDLHGFATHIARQLSAFAQPVFLRICASLQNTETHKPVKSRLAGEGFSVSPGSGTVYLRDRSTGSYVLLDPERHAIILAEQIQL